MIKKFLASLPLPTLLMCSGPVFCGEIIDMQSLQSPQKLVKKRNIIIDKPLTTRLRSASVDAVVHKNTEYNLHAQGYESEPERHVRVKSKVSEYFFDEETPINHKDRHLRLKANEPRLKKIYLKKGLQHGLTYSSKTNRVYDIVSVTDSFSGKDKKAELSQLLKSKKSDLKIYLNKRERSAGTVTGLVYKVVNKNNPSESYDIKINPNSDNSIERLFAGAGPLIPSLILQKYDFDRNNLYDQRAAEKILASKVRIQHPLFAKIAFDVDYDLNPYKIVLSRFSTFENTISAMNVTNSDSQGYAVNCAIKDMAFMGMIKFTKVTTAA